MPTGTPLNDVATPSLLFTEQGTAPTSPAAGQGRIYRGTDGKWYGVNSAGVVAAVGAIGGGVGAGLGYPYTIDPVDAVSFVAVAAGRAVFIRWLEGGTITKLGIEVGVSSGNISLATYPNVGSGRSSAPGAASRTTGSIACPTNGYVEITLSSSLVVAAGDWVALGADNATASFRMISGNAISSLYAGRSGYENSAHPLSGTPTVIPAQRIVPLIVGVA